MELRIAPITELFIALFLVANSLMCIYVVIFLATWGDALAKAIIEIAHNTKDRF